MGAGWHCQSASRRASSDLLIPSVSTIYGRYSFFMPSLILSLLSPYPFGWHHQAELRIFNTSDSFEKEVVARTLQF